MRVMIIAGEASGDQHSARLVEAVHAIDPSVEFFGIGGEHMRRAGVKTLVDSADMAVVGLVEIWAHRKTIFGALARMREILKTDPPDLLFLTDYPEFNLRLAKTAKQQGVKVLFYISPQIWAWRQWRVKTIRKRVDMMAVIFPFELDFYRRHDVPVRFVGHPLAGEVHASAGRDSLCEEFGLDPRRPVVGLFPGSRQSEVKRLMPIIIDTAKRLRQQNPAIQFLLPIASTLGRESFSPYIDAETPAIHMVAGRGYDVMAACDAIVTVSGTVTLEIALIGTPMVIINRISALSYLIARYMVKVDHIGLCNIVAGKRVVPELIQYDAQAEKISAEILRMLRQPDYRQRIREELRAVRARLGDEAASTDLAKLTLELAAPNATEDK